MLGVESSGMFITAPEFNEFFNLTYNDKMTSNITIPYEVVKDENHKTIGPKVRMKWMQWSEMNETSNYVKSKLQNKYLAAAWIESHSETPYRFLYAKGLQNELA